MKLDQNPTGIESRFGSDNWQEEICSLLGVRYLYPYQMLVIFHFLRTLEVIPSGEEDSPTDLLCLFPTGMGKTICFTGPLLVSNGIGIVVYPLNALLSDQERRFRSLSVPVAVLKGGQPRQEREKILSELVNIGKGVILTNPETLCSSVLETWWPKLKPLMMMVDEAHLVARWGGSFRPVFRSLGAFRQKWNIRILGAFSATVSETDEALLRENLFLSSPPLVVRAPMDRTNLFYSVLVSSASRFFAPILFTPLCRAWGLEPLGQPALVFSPTRSLAEEIALDLQRFFALCRHDDPSIPGPDDVLFYHAGLETNRRTEREKDFYSRDRGIMVCTCAYGTGIDKPNIRSVLHVEPPENPESYIQESGRAGRDGTPARALLIWNPERSGPDWVERYSQPTVCRRQFLAGVLSDTLDGCSGCDTCDQTDLKTRLEDSIVGWIAGFSGFRSTENEVLECIRGHFPRRRIWNSRARRDNWKVLVRLLDPLPDSVLRAWIRSADGRGLLRLK